MSIDLKQVLGEPTILGSINVLGNWSGSSNYFDPYEDITRAICVIPLDSKPSYIISNRRTYMTWNKRDADRKPIYLDILTLFTNFICDNEHNETMILKDFIFRTSPSIPDDIALVVSDHNEVVIINTESNK